uniref:Uncharacterized protein n=1 Tax=Erpetoichthys calabaricus TaxID=27687 RepID=A0A8C4SSV7_ERPCA
MSESKEPALQQLNMQRESWCMVEANSRQSWERTQRKHFKQHLRMKSRTTRIQNSHISRQLVLEIDSSPLHLPLTIFGTYCRSGQ